MASQVVSVEKRYRMSLLLDIYGELLTDKQREFMRRYYEQDYSFGEIAREFKVSRQAIFDSVKHGEASLEGYEGTLKLAARRGGEGDGAASPEAAKALAGAAASLRELADAVLNNGFAGDMKSVAGRIEALAAEIEDLGMEAVAAPRRAALDGAAERPKSIFAKGGGLEVD